MYASSEVSELDDFTLVWKPGNDEADRRAKQAPPNQFAAIPFSVGEQIVTKHLELKHQARWAACTGCRQSKVLMSYPLTSRANGLLAMSRLRLRAAVGLLTGHTTLKSSFPRARTRRRARMVMIKRTVYTWCGTALSCIVKYTGYGAVCF